MNDTPDNATREERLAAKLRENLRRRKAQSRAMNTPVSNPGSQTDTSATSKPLPKADSES